MRQIKFRGLRTDGKGWVYGDLLCNWTIHQILSEDDGNEYKVIPESVGQFTGLHDKNGVEIYEGKDSLELHLIGLGRGFVDVSMKDGHWNIYTESQGYAPLFEMLNNNNVELTIHTYTNSK